MSSKRSAAVPQRTITRWMTEKEVSAMLGISESTLQKYRHFKNSDLAHYKVGRLVRYAYEDVLDFMQSKKICVA